MPIYSVLPDKSHLLDQAEAAHNSKNFRLLNQLNQQLHAEGYKIVFINHQALFQKLTPRLIPPLKE